MATEEWPISHEGGRMPDHAPPAPEGCVYGPWWDRALKDWFALTARENVTDDYTIWQWTSDYGWLRFSICDILGRALLRLAKENAELKDTIIMASAVTAKLNEVNAELTAEVEKLRLKESERMNAE